MTSPGQIARRMVALLGTVAGGLRGPGRRIQAGSGSLARILLAESVVP
jgi:hypothetical protein